jgi:hypothetical protein
MIIRQGNEGGIKGDAAAIDLGLGSRAPDVLNVEAALVTENEAAIGEALQVESIAGGIGND